jgi:hypothetical protein
MEGDDQWTSTDLEHHQKSWFHYNRNYIISIQICMEMKLVSVDRSCMEMNERKITHV